MEEIQKTVDEELNQEFQVHLYLWRTLTSGCWIAREITSVLSYASILIVDHAQFHVRKRTVSVWVLNMKNAI